MFEATKKLLPQTIKNYFHLLLAFGSALYFRFPARKLTIVGVTGTDGKTTTTSMIYEALKELGYEVGMVSTVSAKIGKREVSTGLHVTTPSSFELQRLLSEMVRDGVKVAVIEMTSHGLDQNRTAFISVQVAVITNVTPEHLDYHKTMDKYLLAKAKILRGAKFRILNIDDPSFAKLRLKGSGQLVTFGLKENSDLGASGIQETEYGLEFQLLIKSRKEKQSIGISIPLAGRFNVYNALATFATLRAFDISEVEFPRLLAKFPGVKGRMQFVDAGQDFFCVVDFAHTPASLESALKSLKQYQHNKLICVFGAASERDKFKRSVMGKIAASLADYSIFTSEDPRKEDPNQIIDEISKGALEAKGVLNETFWKIPDRASAIRLAIRNLAKSGDIVAVFGKGHETSMNIQGKEIPWSDEKEIKEAVKERLGR